MFLEMVCSDYITTCQSLYNLKYIKQDPLAVILKWKNQIWSTNSSTILCNKEDVLDIL